MMNSLLKFISIAVLSTAILIGVKTDQEIPDQSQASDLIDYLDYSAHKHNHADGEMCAFDRKIEERIAKDPAYAQELEHYQKVVMPRMVKEYQEKKARGALPPIISIPVVFHIYHKDSEGIGQGQNLDDQTILDAVNTLNEDFQALNDAYENKVPDRFKPLRGNAEIHFCLPEFDPDGNPSTGIIRHAHNGPYTDAMHDQVKREHGWPSQKYYNIYVVPIITGAAGYAYLPSGGIIGSKLDGTVCDNAYVGAGIPVLTHEVGHGLGLYHTFNGGCGGDDGIEDTPKQGTTSRAAPKGGNVNCTIANPPTGPISCDDIEHNWVNFMDYTSFSCMSMFTQGQVDVMRSVLLGSPFALTNGVTWASRKELADNAIIAAPSCSPSVPPGGGGTNPDPDPDPDPVVNDAGIRNILEPSDPEFCSSGNITPIVLLTNDYGEANLTSCKIKYRIVGVPGTTTFNWTGDLATNEQEEVTLAPFVSPNENYDLTVWTTDPNGEEDDNGFNNEKSIGQETISAADPNVIEDFEPNAFSPTDKDIELYNPNNDKTWERVTLLSAYGLGNACVRMPNHEANGTVPDGREDWLVTPLFDFSTINNPRLTFDVAALHNTQLSETDTLEIRVSTDCGETFPTVVWRKGGIDLATVVKGFGPEYFPVDDEWRNEIVGLTQFEGTDKLYVAIINTGYNVNNIYLDNINLAEGCASNVTSEYVDVACGGDCTAFINLNLTGFEAQAEISWSASAGGGSDQSKSGLCAGEYSYTVTDPVYDCEFVETITITQPIPLFVNASVGHETFAANQNNGSINLNVDGGSYNYSYTWSDGGPNDARRTFLAPGIYCVTVEDTNGCTFEECYEVLPFGCSTAVIATVDQYPCAPGELATVTVEVSGNAFPVTIVWQHDFFLLNQTTATNVPPGVWSVFVQEQLNDCEAEVVIEIFESVDDNPFIIHESNAGASNGTIDPMVSGGSGEFTYSWSNNETSPTISNLSAGDYTVTITDIETGCMLIETYTVLLLNCDMEVSWTITPVTCFGGDDGQINVMVTGGSGNFTYNWTDAGLSGSNLNGLESGTYQILVEDANGCQELHNIFLQQPGMITVEFEVMDESVPGAQDGSINTTVSGGTPGYQYEWSANAGSNANASGLGGGTYNVTVTDANGCTTVQGATVIGIECPEFMVEGLPSDIACNGGSTGSINVTVEGPLGPFTYAWNSGQDSGEITGVPAGDYEVVITDEDSGCTTSYEVSLTEPDALSLQVDGMAESNLGANDGSVSAMVSGGTSDYSYEWTDANGMVVGTTAMVSELGPGEYCVEITDANECTIEDCFTITAGADPCAGFSAVSGDHVPVSCNGGSDGVATVIITGGTEPYTYTWSDDQDGEQATGLSAGEILVTIVDGNGCESMTSVTVTEPTALALSTSGTNESVQNASDGTVTAMANGGTGSYTYEWTDANGMVVGTGAMVSGLAPGEYCVEIRDENNCTTTDCYEVLAGGDPCVNTDLGIELLGGTLDCVSQQIELVAQSFGGSGNVSYEWQDGTMGATYTVTVAGAYTVVGTDELGCTAESIVEVNQDTNLPDISVTNTSETSAGASDGTVTVSVVNGTDFTVSWFNAAGMMIGSDLTLTDLAPGEYCAVVTNPSNGCETEMCTEVVGGSDPCADSPAVEVNNLTGTGIITCEVTSIEIEALATGGDGTYTYQWGDGSDASTLLVTEAGTYTIVIEDGNGCMATNMIIIEEDVLDPVILTTSSPESSIGASDGTVSVIAGADDIIEWRDASGMIISMFEVVMSLAPGEYCVTVTGPNGCTSEECVEVLSGSDPCIGFSAEINSLNVSDVSCNGGSDGTAEVIVTGGTAPYTYAWADGQEDATAINLEAGVYTVVVSDANDCEQIVEIEITEPEAMDLALSGTNESSAGAGDGSASASVSGGTGSYTYSWTGPNGYTASTATIEDLTPGEYCVVVSDENGCELEEQCYEVSGGDDPCRDFEVIAEGGSVSCFEAEDGSLDLVIEGGTAPYEILFGGIPITSITGTSFTSPAILPTGVASFTIVDANGCEQVVEAEITSPEELLVEVSTSGESVPGASDGSASASVSGGTSDYSYLWNTGDTTPNIEGLPSGEYCVTVTDANDCTVEECIEVTQGSDPCADFGVEVISEGANCPGGADGYGEVSVFNGTQPYEIEWSDGNTSDLERNDLPAGTYTFTLVDANGCEGNGSITIEEPATIEINITASNETLLGAGDGEAEADVSGGSGEYTYSWSGGNNFSSTVEDLMDLEPGVYCLVVTDGNGCESEEVCVEISTGSDPCLNFEASLALNAALCNGEESGSATIDEVVGGTAPYTYEWSDGQTGLEATGLGAGPIGLTLTDLNGCELTLEGEIEEPSAIELMLLNTVNESDTGANDGSLEVGATGGVGEYTYEWSNGASGSLQEDLACGDYQVTVTDANGCEQMLEANVGCSDLGCETLTAEYIVNPVSCFSLTDGSIEVIPSGGTAPYEVDYNSGLSGENVGNLPTGIYALVVTDANGCTIDLEIEVIQPSPLQAMVEGYDGVCGIQGSAEVTPIGGTGPYTVEWNTGAETGIITGLETGEYSCTITDINGCTQTGSVSIENNYTPLAFEVEKKNVTCNGGSDGFITVTITEGQGPFSYEWSNGSTDPEIYDLSADQYTLIITDGDGCEYALSRDVIEPNALDLDYIVAQGGTSTTFDVTLNVNGGTPPYTFDWNDGSVSVINVGMTVGTYEVTITDERGCSEVFEIVIDGSITSIAGLEILEEMRVYPNPTSGNLDIVASLSRYAELDLQLYNVLGQKVLQRKVSGKEIKDRIDISDQASGTYYLKLGNANGSVVEKIVKF